MVVTGRVVVGALAPLVVDVPASPPEEEPSGILEELDGTYTVCLGLTATIVNTTKTATAAMAPTMPTVRREPDLLVATGALGSGVV